MWTYLKKIDRLWMLFSFFMATALIFFLNPAFAQEERFTDALPFGKEFVIEKGFGDKLPLPCGFAWGVTALEQNMGLKSIELKCSKFDPLFSVIDPIIKIIDITSDDIDTKNYACNLRFDAWILPFMNVYGILGYVDGETEANAVTAISPDADVSELVDLFISLGLDVFNGDGTINLSKVSNILGVAIDRIGFEMSFSGYNYGIGITFAGGYGNYFAIIDMNYVYSDLDVADSTIETTTVSFRTGADCSIGKLKGNVYIGAMWMETEEKQTGWVDYAGVEVKYTTITESTEPWHYLTGVRWVLSREISFTVEAGYSPDRQMGVFMTEYRF